MIPISIATIVLTKQMLRSVSTAALLQKSLTWEDTCQAGFKLWMTLVGTMLSELTEMMNTRPKLYIKGTVQHIDQYHPVGD